MKYCKFTNFFEEIWKVWAKLRGKFWWLISLSETSIDIIELRTAQAHESQQKINLVDQNGEKKIDFNFLKTRVKINTLLNMAYWKELNTLCLVVAFFMSIQLFTSEAEVEDICTQRGRNCSWCLSDGNCGFCDGCGDHCHKPGAIHSLENCTNCASCVPGALGGVKKGYECRNEWWVGLVFSILTKMFHGSCVVILISPSFILLHKIIYVKHNCLISKLSKTADLIRIV